MGACLTRPSRTDPVPLIEIDLSGGYSGGSLGGGKIVILPISKANDHALHFELQRRYIHLGLSIQHLQDTPSNQVIVFPMIP